MPPKTQPQPGWRAALAAYRDKRLVVIFLMGFSSGLPLLLGFSTLSYWLAKVGVDRTTIGLLLFISTPYAFKFGWAPLVDHLKLPWQGIMGRRRAWLLPIQILLAGSILLVGLSDPIATPLLFALAALAMASLSATQDIVIDAYRIEILAPHEQGLGAAATQAGYRIGLIAAGAGALALSDVLDWGVIYAVMASLMLVGIGTTLIADEPQLERRRTPADYRQWIYEAVVEPFLAFRKNRAWFAVLVFVLLYKYGDALAGAMFNPFFNDLGFTGTEIAAVTKLWGIIATLGGVFLGGLFIVRFGLFATLLVGGILQAASNLLFSLLATLGNDFFFLNIAFLSDSLVGGLGSAAFVAYLSGLCNRSHTATQYALLTSIMALGRTGLSAGSGWLSEQVDWVSFFALTSLIAIPGLLLILWLWRLDKAKPQPT